MSSTGVRGEAARPRVLHARLAPPETLARWSRVALIMSVSLLAAAPLMVPDSYSVVEHTLSESGAQGVEGAWFFRGGVLMTAGAVMVLSVIANSRWTKAGRWGLRVYAIALIMLAVFPEAPWNGAAHDETVEFLHTVSGVVGACAFILGVVAISRARPRSRRARVFDWVVIAVVALMPQLMLFSAYDGLMQRTMVFLGYVWLLAEATRVVRDSGAGAR